MLKDITNCPCCGSHLADVGVIEARAFLLYPNDGGWISWSSNRTELDDGLGLSCAKCGYGLDSRTVDGVDGEQLIG